jgi:mRNA interferase RelE/StbE
MYEVLIENRARKQSLAFPQTQLDRILEAIVRLAENPRPVGARKLSDRPGWRVRVGDYRVLYTIDDAARMVRVYRIAHRREAYR